MNSHLLGRRTEPLAASGKLPDYRDLVFVMHKMRPFILERERTSFTRVLSRLGKYLAHDSFRDCLGSLRERWTGREFESQVQFYSMGRAVRCEQFLMNWLYAYEYHRNQVRKAEVDSLLRGMPVELSRFIFVATIAEKVTAVLGLSQLVEAAMGKRDHTEWVVRSPG